MRMGYLMPCWGQLSGVPASLAFFFPPWTSFWGEFGLYPPSKLVSSHLGDKREVDRGDSHSETQQW